MPTTVATTALVFVGACIVLDVRSRRIPNVLSLAGLVAGVLLNVTIDGASGLLQSAAGIVVPIVILLPAFAVDGIGGGDVKMMAALGAILGARLAVLGLICGVILGGIIMMVHLVRIGRAREKLRSTYTMVVAMLHTGSLAPLKAPASDPMAVSLPYSVPLGLGIIVTLSVHSLLVA